MMILMMTMMILMMIILVMITDGTVNCKWYLVETETKTGYKHGK